MGIFFFSVYRVPSALLFQWRIIILLTKFRSGRIISCFHKFHMVGTLWRGASKASYIFKTTRARWNRGSTNGWGIWQGIRRDRRNVGTSCAVFLIPEDEDNTEETEVTFGARRAGGSSNVFDFTGLPNGVNRSAASDINAESCPFSSFIPFFKLH